MSGPSQMEPELKELREADLPSMLLLEEACFSEAWTRGMLAGSLRGAGAITFGLWVKERLIGCLLARVVLDEAELQSISVHPGFQGQGLGGRLLDRLLADCGRQGVARIFLEVNKSNQAALGLYAARGFRQLKVLPDYYGAEGDGLLMACELRAGRRDQGA